MEVFIALEFLADQRRTNDLPIMFDQAPLCLARKNDFSYSCHRQRIDQTRDEREGDEDDDRWANFAQHGVSPQARCKAVTTKSIALMPMNGMITPPPRRRSICYGGVKRPRRSHDSARLSRTAE